MRLIDADALTAELKKSVDYSKKHGHLHDAQFFEACISQLMLAPTVDYVLLGRNISEKNTVDEFECSECGVILEGYSQVIIDDHDNDRSNREYEHSFCPECGAKIDLEAT